MMILQEDIPDDAVNLGGGEVTNAQEMIGMRQMFSLSGNQNMWA